MPPSFPNTNIVYNECTATSQFRVSGGLNQNVIDMVNVLPGSASQYDKYYYLPTSKFATYYGNWNFSDPYPGQMINIPSGANQGIKIINQAGFPVPFINDETVISQGVAYVAKNGNDGTGALNDPAHPFLTIGAAYAAALTASQVYLIYVYPGTYNLSQNICSGLLRYYFCGGVTINYTVTPFANGIGNDISSFMCLGYAKFIGTAQFITISGPAPFTNNVYIECDSLDCQAGDAIYIDNASDVKINIRGTLQALNGRIADLGNTSDGVIRANNLYSNNGIRGSVGEWIVEANYMTSLMGYLFDIGVGHIMRSTIVRLAESAQVPAMNVAGDLYLKTIWMDCAGSWIVSGNCVVSSDNLNNPSSVANSGNLTIIAPISNFGTMNITAGIVSIMFDDFVIGTITQSGGICNLNLGVGNSDPHVINGGTMNCNVNNASFNLTAFTFSNGDLNLKGYYICPKVVDSSSANGNIRLYGIYICSGVNSITSSVARNILSYGASTNKIVGAGILIVGSLTVNGSFV